MVMSYETSTRGGSQKREKSNTGNTSGGGKQTTHKIPQATAEQMRIAQLVNDQQNDDDILLSKNVSQIIEVTGTSEENALLALYDSSNDPTRAIELILERGSKGEDSGWETAGRRKNRGGASVTRNNTDAFDDDSKDDKTNDNRREWDGGESRGRGRGARRGKGRGGRNQDRSRTTDDNDKENENYQDRSQRRGGGRGRGRSGANRGRGGRGRGGGAPRHYKNQTFGSKYGDDSNMKDSLTEPVDMWRGSSTECWDIEVGTWSSEDAQKQKSEKEKNDNSFGDNWGTESWNDELTETKVFQAQSIQIPPVQSITGNNNAPDRGGPPLIQSGGDNTMTNHYPGTTPQTGERIDLGMLFKKSGNSSLRPGDNTSSYGGMGYGNTTQSHSVPQHNAPDVIQQLQQHGQSNSLFSESNSSASRLFSDYDQRGQQSQQTSQQQSATDSLFKQNEASVDSSYSQLNGKLAPHSSQPKNISSTSSFLDSFSGLGGPNQSQSGMLGQLADLSSKQTSMSSYSQVRQQDSAVGNRGAMNSFSQGQQKQATDAVKASLGIPIGGNQSSMRHGSSQVQSSVAEMQMQNQGSLKDESHLSFGSPLPPQINQQSKQQRKKMPSMPPKIPASAVEMPGNSAYNSQFSLQFGADDSGPMDPSSLSSTDYGVGMPHNGGSQNIMAQQRSLFLNNDVPSEKQQTNHLSSSVTDQSLFSQSAQQMTPTKNEMQRNQENVMMPSQRIGDSPTVTGTTTLDAPARAPPGLTIPASASSALSSLTNAGNGGHVGSGRHGNDLGSGYNAPNDHMTSARSLDSSLNQVSSLSSSFSQVHSYYSSTTPTGSQKQNQQMQSDLSSSAGRSLHSPVPSSSLPGSLQSSPMPKMMQRSGNTPVKDPTSNIEPAATSLSNMSSLATSLSQASISSPAAPQHHHHSTGPSAINQSSMLSSALSTAVSTGLPYSASSLSTSVSRGLSDSISSGTAMGKSGYDSTQDSMSSFSSSYTSTPSNVVSSAMLTQSQQATPSQTPSTITTIANMQASGFNSQTTSTLSSSTLGGFATAKMPHPITNKAPLNIPPGVTTPILQSQYGIPMAGLMPYAPDMQYGYDQLLLAQSRVINPLQNYYDMHFHNNTQNAAVNGRDSTAQVSSGQSKYNREPSSPTPTASQLPNLSGSMGSGLSQHNSTVSQQSSQLKGSQTAGHHSAQQQQQQQQFVGAAMPAYAGYSSLATPYYGLGMPSTAGFQYPPTMFAAAMHQAPKHSVNTTTGFQQPTTGFGHSYSNATITSSSGLPDLQGSNYSKTHASAFEKQQGYHQHTNTPPPFNLQAITAAVAAGGGANTGGGAPGLSPYGTAPYMTMLPHQASQQQAIHLLQQQHQDATGGQPIGSQRSLGSNSLVKSANKQSAYGNVASGGYWGN